MRFDGEQEAVGVIARTLDEGRSVMLTRSSHGRETERNSVVLNPADAGVEEGSAEAGQCL
ncbi:hypothetical protein AB0B45_40470 [Nonomuraea sp. NPDC049152]|uniref:hypothetical protein n=1 Tax=Nonomuraea sp. NPDC049152 TaxID=3154350 RepID=UPI0033E7BECD